MHRTLRPYWSPRRLAPVTGTATGSRVAPSPSPSPASTGRSGFTVTALVGLDYTATAAREPPQLSTPRDPVASSTKRCSRVPLAVR
jgi:hypothetical protein